MAIDRTKNNKQRQVIGKEIEAERIKQELSISHICRKANIKKEQYYKVRKGQGYSIDTLLSIIKVISLEIHF